MLNNLALLYRNQGRYAEAEPLYMRSLAIWETALGSGHPEVASSLNNQPDDPAAPDEETFRRLFIAGGRIPG